MTGKTIALMGGPETGKTNYMARLWTSLRNGGGSLAAPSIPEDITYVEDAVSHLLEAKFAPRTLESGISGTLEIPIRGADGTGIEPSVLKVPDVMGEEWDKAVHDREAKREIFEVLSEADGALLFVRILSELNEAPLDWVTAQKLLAMPFDQKEPSGRLPTQVSLCELLSLLEFTTNQDLRHRKVAIIVTGWDLLDQETARSGPAAYLQAEFPMFAGRILAASSLEVRAFGVSVVGGDLDNDEEFRTSFLQTDLHETGFVVYDTDDGLEQTGDITEPVRWLLAN